MSALISDCGLFRWTLERDVQLDGITALLCGVNPSTADASVNDHTIMKDIGFSKVLGWRRFIKVNVFPYRATDVRKLRDVADHRLAENAEHIRRVAADADIIVPMWGRRDKLPPVLRPQLAVTLALLRSTGKPLFTFGFTASGDPLHPLMLSATRRRFPRGSVTRWRQHEPRPEDRPDPPRHHRWPHSDRLDVQPLLARGHHAIRAGRAPGAAGWIPTHERRRRLGAGRWENHAGRGWAGADPHDDQDAPAVDVLARLRRLTRPSLASEPHTAHRHP